MACVGCSCGSAKTENPQDAQGATAVKGCSSGGCSTGGCNRLNTYDWLSAQDIQDSERFESVEVSFKNGSHKEFFFNPDYTQAVTGDWVAVDTGAGYDIGKVTLSGEMVRLQMKKKRVSESKTLNKVLRIANGRDLERMEEARSKEMPTMVRARAIVRTLELDMKIGDIEFQADGKKATFFYTADGRIDFRELIRHFAKEFRVKIEMRQIGIRQEAARIGGLGSCGRELCCSTWLTNFKSVNTGAARYQNLAINQAKLSGQCGRLKCCLNYELDAYMDAFSKFPKRADKLKAQSGTANLFKTDIFKGIMYYMMDVEGGRRLHFALDIEVVKKVQAMNKKGEFPADFTRLQIVEEKPADEDDFDFGTDDLTGVIELPAEKRRKKGRGNRNSKRSGKGGNRSGGAKKSGNQPRGKGDAQGKGGKNAPKGKGKPTRTGGKPKSKSNAPKSNNPKGNNPKSNNPKGKTTGNAPKAQGGQKSNPNAPKKEGGKSRNNRNRNRNRNRNKNKDNAPKGGDTTKKE